MVSRWHGRGAVGALVLTVGGAVALSSSPAYAATSSAVNAPEAAAAYVPNPTQNWCGYVAQGNPGQADQVQAEWTVPKATPIPSTYQNESDWIGIGAGSGVGSLIQIGTDMTSQNGEKPTIYAFIEEFVPQPPPKPAKDKMLRIVLKSGTANSPILQGEHIVADLFPDSPTQWHWQIRDYGVGGTTQKSISDYFWSPPYHASADSAEVIHEVSPPLNRGGTMLPTTPVTFTHAQVAFLSPITNVRWFSDYIGTSAHRVAMPSQPSSANGQFAFTCADGSHTPPTPPAP